MKKLGFGTMRLPVLNPNDPKSIDYEQVKRMADLFLDEGFTYVDTAYMYHGEMSEHAVKVAFSDRYPRESFYLADKMPVALMHSKDEYPTTFALQLERCGVEYFDNYLLHNVYQETMGFINETDGFGFLRRVKDEGRAHHIGFSFHGNPELLDHLLTEHPEVEFVQLQLNYIDWDNPTIQAGKNYEVCQQHGKRVIVMEPVKGGVLAKLPEEIEAAYRALRPENSIASWALRFAASLEGVDVVLSGMSNFEQMTDNLATMSDFQPLTVEERQVMDGFVNLINSRIMIPCTGCHYCVNHGDGCPMNIPIPEIFAITNAVNEFGNSWGSNALYRGLMDIGHGKPSDCVACGQCEAYCPQHIRIIEMLKKVRGIEELGRRGGKFIL